MNSRIFTIVVVPLAMAIGLTGCTAVTPPTDETYASASNAPVEPTAPVTPNPIEPDTLLIVRATATAGTGARLALEMQVHQSTAWDDVATQTMPLAMTEDCAGTLDETIYEAGMWSFTRVNVTAIPADASAEVWPVDARVDVQPLASAAPVIGRGFLVGDEASSEAPVCLRDKFFIGTGKGGLALGIAGDAADDGARFTGWADHRFGFNTPDNTGVTLSDCTFEVTALGSQLGGAAQSRASVLNASTCVTGAEHEVSEN